MARVVRIGETQTNLPREMSALPPLPDFTGSGAKVNSPRSRRMHAHADPVYSLGWHLLLYLQGPVTWVGLPPSPSMG